MCGFCVLRRSEVDWWTLGILTFELCSGHPPFESATPMQIYAKAALPRAATHLRISTLLLTCS